MSKVLFSTPVAFNKVIQPRDPMPSVEQNAQKARKPYTEETQADNPYHNEAFPKSKMPKKAHKPQTGDMKFVDIVFPSEYISASFTETSQQTR